MGAYGNNGIDGKDEIMKGRTFKVFATAALALSLLSTAADARGGGGGGGGHGGGFGGGGGHMGGFGGGFGGGHMAGGIAAGHVGGIGGEHLGGIGGQRFAGGGFGSHAFTGHHLVRHTGRGFGFPGYYDDYGYGCPYVYGPLHPHHYPWVAGCS
jgi:hypothetical protein